MNDQKLQAKVLSCSTEVYDNKILFQINDQSTYRSQWDVSQFKALNLQKIREQFEQQSFKILSKTKNIIRIELGFLNLEFKSIDYEQIQKLKEQLNVVLKQCEKLKARGWQEEDLNSTAPFDINCLYRLTINDFSMTCSLVSADALYFFWNNNTCYSLQKGNRKGPSTGGTLKNIWKQRIC